MRTFYGILIHFTFLNRLINELSQQCSRNLMLETCNVQQLHGLKDERIQRDIYIFWGGGGGGGTLHQR